MGRVKHLMLCALGGVAAVAFVAGLFVLGYYAPDWLAVVIPLAAIFVSGALVAHYILLERR